MDRRRFRIMIAGLAVLTLAAFLSPHKRADIRIAMQEQGDTNPQTLSAAVDIGLIAVSVLISWTRKLGE